MTRTLRRGALRALAGTAALALLPLQAALAAPPRVALVMKSLANEFFQTMEDGAKAYQKEHASEFTLIANGIKDETDTAAQIKIVQQMVVEHVDAIVIAPADSKALVPVLADAAAKGVIIVNIDNKLDAGALQEKKPSSCPSSGPTTARARRWSATCSTSSSRQATWWAYSRACRGPSTRSSARRVTRMR